MSKVRILIVGDLMFSGGVAREIGKAGRYDFPLARIRSFLSDADFVFGNLETPISRKKIPQRFVAEAIYHTDPSTAQALAGCHIGAVCLANNHVYDYGAEGVAATIRSLGKAGVGYVGIGRQLPEARRPLIVDVNGYRVGFLAYCSASTVTRKSNEYVVAPIESRLIERDVIDLKKHVDFVVVVMHEGTCRFPSPEYRRLAQKAVEYGASLVVGHHPHVINGIERYGQGVIAYGLGNFVADCDASENRRTFILECTISSGKLVDVRPIPIWINSHYQPEIAEGKQAEEISSHIDYLSELLSTGENDRAYYAEMNKSYWAMQYREIRRSYRAEGARAIIRKISKIRLHHVRLALNKVLWRK